MSPDMFDGFRGRLEQRLKQRAEKDLFRKCLTLHTRHGIKVEVDGQELINFSSNDYLGLSYHPKLIAALKTAADTFGIGSSSSPLISGRSDLHRQLEEKLAEKTGRDAALIFSSGYMANLAVATTFVGRSDAIYLDRLAHASMIDAARLSAAKLHRYQHADPDSLQQMLSKNGAKEKLVLTDTIFSMDGDELPLKAFIAVCNKNHAILVVDDAHGFGVLGKTGGGLMEKEDCMATDVPILVATFGKALGTAGAFIAADKTIIQTLIQFGRSYIYTTAPPPALISATIVALEILQSESWRREKLNSQIKYFRTGARDLQLQLLPSETAIQALIIGDTARASRISEELMHQGFLIPAIKPPTVPVGSARLRITITAMHTKEQIDRLLETLGGLMYREKDTGS